MFSEKDGRLTLTIPGVIDDYEILTQKDAAFDTGDASASVTGARGVAFHAEGAGKPTLSATVVSGFEGAKIRALCINPATGKKRTNIAMSWSFRRDGHSLAYRFEQCMLGEGGGVKASDGEGLAGDKALKFLIKRAQQSIDGSAFRRIA